MDLAAASTHGVAVFNAPFSNTRSVVELVISEIVALQRGLTDKSRKMHEGVWDKSAHGSHEVRGRRLGIVGYGNIGSQLSVLAEALGMSVYFYDTADKLALGNARMCSSLEELLEAVDIVTLHVDGRSSNKGMFGQAEFARMRQGQYFLEPVTRVCRRPCGVALPHRKRPYRRRRHRRVPERAQAQGRAFCFRTSGPAQRDPDARMSVAAPRRPSRTSAASSPASSTTICRLGSTSLSVNLPNLVLPPRAGEFRLTHVHENVPGVLAAVNSLFAAHGLNIEGQYLGTSGSVGYVITDTPDDFPPDVVAGLVDMPSTIRLRVL